MPVSHIITTDATVTIIDEIEIPTDSAATLDILVNGEKSDGTQSLSIKRIVNYKNISDTLSKIGSYTEIHLIKTVASWAVTLGTSGTFLQVKVKGQVATTINWNCEVKRL